MRSKSKRRHERLARVSEKNMITQYFNNSPSICLCIIKCQLCVFSHQVYHIHAQTNNAGADAWVKVPEACNIIIFIYIIIVIDHDSYRLQLFSVSFLTLAGQLLGSSAELYTRQTDFAIHTSLKRLQWRQQNQLSQTIANPQIDNQENITRSLLLSVSCMHAHYTVYLACS